MDLLVDSTGFARWGTRQLRCALGRAGIGVQKREGDGATPCGAFALRRVFYRPDREPRPQTALPCQATAPTDGWCDAPSDAAYNRLVALPYPASAENLWREDGLYDLIAVLGHNDDPVVPGQGSAIFLHLAAPDYTPTAGCIALARNDLLAVFRDTDAGSRVIVSC
jgi:L,D-peptidoglycan transpeptidase YkuD (ErfK/YbiS/YcfS/YnhG family)